GVGAGDRDPAHRDGLAGADVLVSEAGRRVAVGEDVTGDAVVSEGDRDDRGAVVDLVHPGGRDRQVAPRDVGRRRGGGVGEAVVGGVGAGVRCADDGYGVGRAGVVVGESGGGVAGYVDSVADDVVDE